MAANTILAATKMSSSVACSFPASTTLSIASLIGSNVASKSSNDTLALRISGESKA